MWEHSSKTIPNNLGYISANLFKPIVADFLHLQNMGIVFVQNNPKFKKKEAIHLLTSLPLNTSPPCITQNLPIPLFP